VSKAQQLEELYEEMGQCSRCPGLLEHRRAPIRGRGNPDAARIVIVGEAPGADENEEGEAFVGRAGRLLDELLAKLSSDKRQAFRAAPEDFYMTNAISCWPAQLNRLYDPPKLENRTPTAEEVATCHPWIERIIRIIDPVALVLAGEVPSASFGLRGTITSLQGRMTDVHLQGVKRTITYCAMPVFHPSYLLRTRATPRLREITESNLQALVDRAWAYYRVSRGLNPIPVEGG